MTTENTTTNATEQAANEIIEGMSTTKKVLIYSGVALVLVVASYFGGKFLFGSADAPVTNTPTVE